MKVELIALRLIRMGGTYFGAPVLEFSTFLEETEDGTIHVHASCTRPFTFISVHASCLWPTRFYGEIKKAELIALRSIRVRGYKFNHDFLHLKPKRTRVHLVGLVQVAVLCIVPASVASNNVENSRAGAQK